MQTQEKSKKEYITFLSVLSCIAVVFLHVNGTFWQFSKSATWITANIIESVFYFAVSVFFMISGTTLLDYRKKYDTKTYFKKRAVKALIPYLIWSCIYEVWKIVGMISRNEPVSAVDFFQDMISGRACSYFGFFIPLFAVYLLIPVLSLIPEEKRKTIFPYILVLGFTAVSIVPYIFRQLSMEFPGDFRVFACPYVLYALLGYCIDRYPIKTGFRIGIYLLGIGGLALHIVGTQILSYRAGAIVTDFKEYDNFPCLFYSAAIFVFFKYLFEKHPLRHIPKTILNFLSKATFGVYLVQYFVITGFGSLIGEFEPFVPFLLYRTLGALGIYLLCTVCVRLIQCIPVVRHMTP